MGYLFLLIFLFLSCETQEKDAINQAQSCLDKASPSEAGSCVYFVTGLETAESYAIRCSANFLAEGLNASMMADALVKRDSSTTNQNPLLGMMGVLAFRTMDKANETYIFCQKSTLSSFVMFASMARMSTKITSVGSLVVTSETKPTQEQMEQALQTLVNDDSDESKEIIGESASALSETYCTEENIKTKVCQDIASAVTSGATNIEIGEIVISNLQNYISRI